MVLKPEPLIQAVNHVKSKGSCLVSLTPQGRRLDQEFVKKLATHQHIVIICGRYKGIDERVRRILKPTEVSIGDYVLSGGEIGALVLIESITRLLPGILGNKDSAHSDSFESNLLASAIYTQPRTYRKHNVPQVVRGGHHKLVNQ